MSELMSQEEHKTCIVGIDTGGTFTDFVCFSDGKIKAFKILSTPADPAQAILDGISRIRRMGLRIQRIVHGTTVATNALLESKGVPTAFITNSGIEDLLIIGRQARNDIYALTPKTEREAIERRFCIGVSARMNANGETIQELTEPQLETLVETLKRLPIKAVAVCLLFAFKDDRHERMLAKILEKHWFCSISSQVAAEQKEYERGITTWLNSYLGPVIRNYLKVLQCESAIAGIRVMQSSGLTLDISQAGDCAARLLLSGPAGGYIAARRICKECEIEHGITLDMGGTSTDVALIAESEAISSTHQISGYPISLPALDIHTVGAGGGSIAWLDEGGVLQLGPRSAGASPGPAAYQRGGTDATVTDANVVLGRIPVSLIRSAEFSLSNGAANQAIAKLADQIQTTVTEVASGIIRLANESMLEALRVITVLKGHDPRSFTLMCFGGAAALHVCDLAEALGSHKVIFPAFAGQLSALGMLLADEGEEIAQSVCQPLLDYNNDQIEEMIEEISRPLKQRLDLNDEELICQAKIDLRYLGQTSCLTVPWLGCEKSKMQFEAQYQQRFGYRFEDLPVEFATLRVKVTRDAALRGIPERRVNKVAQPIGETFDGLLGQCIPVFLREDFAFGQQIKGPCVILDEGSTLYVGTHWWGELDRWGHIHLSDAPNYRYN